MRVLFYLPVVTQWWFDAIVVHLIRALAAETQVHVIVPPLWRNTGIGPEQLAKCSDLTHVGWHIWDADDHPALRFSGDAALLDLVHAIDPHLTLCRSADFATPARFPGTVRYLMEAGALPLPTADDWLTIQDRPFVSGVMPTLADGERANLAALFEPVRAEMDERHARDRTSVWRVAAGIPFDRRILALPLEYRHEENFFTRYSRFAENADLVADLAARLPEGWMLAVTNHPLNVLYADNSALHDTIAANRDRVRLIRDQGYGGQATMSLVANSDAMVVENSKTFAAGAWFGVPVQRTSPFTTAPWLHAHRTLEGVLAEGAARPSAADAATWLGHHLANDVIDPDHPDFDAAELLSRIDRPHDPSRWSAGIERFMQGRPDLTRC